MKEILFRGQIYRGRTRKGGLPLPSNWVYGGILAPNDPPDTALIYEYETVGTVAVYAVYRETVSQYTGMKDLNGTKIFEGDIVNAGVKGSRKRLLYTVGYDDAYAAFWLFDEYNEPTENLVIWSSETQLEVIGNKWDNPELLNEPQRSKPKNKDMER